MFKQLFNKILGNCSLSSQMIARISFQYNKPSNRRTNEPNQPTNVLLVSCERWNAMSYEADGNYESLLSIVLNNCVENAADIWLGHKSTVRKIKTEWEKQQKKDKIIICNHHPDF